MARNKKREDKRYVVSKRFCGVRKFFYGKSEPEAQAKLDAYEQENIRQAYHSDMLLKDWYETWKKIVQVRITRATLENYEMIIDAHIIPRFGEYPLDTINHIEIREWLNNKFTTDGLSARTVNYIHTLFKTMLKQAVEDDILTRNPMDKVRKVKAANKREKIIINAAQFEKLLPHVERDDIRRLLHVAIRTGLRREEILGLRWQDINYNNLTLSVNQTVLRLDNQPMIVNNTKTETSVRTIGISEYLVDVFKQQRKYVMQCKQINSRFLDRDLVFSDTDGAPYNPDYLTKTVIRAGKNAGLPKGFSYYSLRHTHATILLESGITIKAIQNRMGHKTFATTAGYLHVTAQASQACVDKMEDFLTKKESARKES